MATRKQTKAPARSKAPAPSVASAAVPADNGAGDGETEQSEAAPRAGRNDSLVTMTHGRNTLRVHPTCVEDHERLGWARA